MIGIIFLLFALAGLLVLGNMLIKLLLVRALRLQLAYTAALLLALFFIASMLIYSGMGAAVVGALSLNPFSLFFIMIFTMGTLLVNILAYSSGKDYGNFAVLSSFALLGMYLVASSVSLMGIFVGLELTTLPSVFIILLGRNSMEAATKLFIMISVAIAIFSFATVLVYGYSGSFLLQKYSGGGVLLFASILFLVAIGFEASVFPFSLLIPDIYEGSPAYVTAMLGGINKKVGFAAMLQVLILVFIAYRTTFLAVAVLSVLTMLYGNIVALVQGNVKRMLAYSSISQAGYILIGIAVGTGDGISAALVQIFAHMFIFIGLLGAVEWLERRNRLDIDSYIGLSDENRFAALSITIFMLSLIGLPFTTGFVGKLLLFVSAISANFTWLAVAGIINSIISIFYYAKVVIAMYTSKEGYRRFAIGRNITVVIAVCLAVTVIAGIYPAPLISLAKNAAAFLIGVR